MIEPPSKSPISRPMRDEIIRRLKAAEAEHNIKIIYACESGSRAWGFASPDSDYDVRFLYVHTTHWYMTFDVERRRDVVEYPIVDEIDCGGWDLRKAMHLFMRTNGALFEWLNSPIKYIEQGETAEQMRSLAPKSFNKTALCYHYSHMARGNARGYLFGDQVRLKKYFYVLRPLLAIRYMEKDLGIPPVRFADLVQAVAPDQLVPQIDRLLELKKGTPELGYGPRIDVINQFVESELDRHGEAFKGQGRPEVDDEFSVRDRLNEIFRAATIAFK